VAPVSIAFGIVLVLVGLGFFFGTATDQYHPTALIPAYFGLALLLLGLLALKEGLRKHAMHLAAMVGLVGFLIPVVRLAMHGATMAGPALAEHTILAVACLLFVALCVRSFIEARRRRGQKTEP
jgi:hypothetical protein